MAAIWPVHCASLCDGWCSVMFRCCLDRRSPAVTDQTRQHPVHHALWHWPVARHWAQCVVLLWLSWLVEHVTSLHGVLKGYPASRPEAIVVPSSMLDGVQQDHTHTLLKGTARTSHTSGSTAYPMQQDKVHSVLLLWQLFSTWESNWAALVLACVACSARRLLALQLATSHRPVSIMAASCSTGRRDDL